MSRKYPPSRNHVTHPSYHITAGKLQTPLALAATSFLAPILRTSLLSSRNCAPSLRERISTSLPPLGSIRGLVPTVNL